MAFSVNRVTLVGNISQEPQVTYSAKGTAILKLSVATNWSRKNDATGEWEDEPSFHRVTMFGNQGEYMGGQLTKGDKVYLDGRIQYGSYEKEGITRYTTDIIAQNLISLGGKGGGGNSAAPSSRPANASKDPSASSPSTPSGPKAQAEGAGQAPTMADHPKPTAPKEEISVDDIPF